MGGVGVAVMAKAPVPGRVKTRLCPPCTPTQAAEVAMACLLDTLDAVAACDAARRVLVLEGDPGDWVPEGFEVVPQIEGDLSQRLGAAIERLGAPLLLIGMDTPQLDGALLDAAIAELESPAVDAVLGPATDGGFWTLGVTVADPGCVVGVPMSRPDTGERQRHRLEQLELRVARLPELRDVDTIEDALAVARTRPDRRLAVALAGMGLLVP
jgi:rSAM/selenodomain-associated transferase 1